MGGAPLWRALVAVQVAGVCWLAFDPQPPPATDTLNDKVNHALAFAVMAFSSRLGWPPAAPWQPALALIGFGVFIEVVQTFIPGRSGEWPDLVADALGIALGLVAHRLAHRFARP